MRVSIIIPTLDDNPALVNLLQQISNWPNQAYEVLVVDAKYDEACSTICERYAATHISFNKNRGAQQRHGAEKASGDVLWFLHADATPSPDALLEIQTIIGSGAMGGFFRFAFNTETTSWTQKLISAFTNWRSKHFIAYGDQGIFVDAKFYATCGGHSDQALFEEVALIRALRKSGKLKPSDLSIRVSTRRWEQDGYWKRTVQNRFLALAYLFGVQADTLASWYKPKR
ncbi:MAG: glycosyltransferase [Gammaproteobacteria bacterium]|nr:TIGR04283 family arsenosugar biosynthesis glycosyltransferase [Gammaproteobacteria bacterium]NNC97684.1 glycosyltransferase [Gammaproteobacteria bacterium]NNM12860.1 glycosyltransferase [Gammaproteobacteria bacterium]